MPELRIILLVVGALFVAGIAGFEWWRSRGQRPAASVSRGNARQEGARIDSSDEDTREAPRVADRRERAELKSLPEINVVREARMAVPDSLPVIELASTTDTGTRRALGISISNEVAVDQIHEPVHEEAPRADVTDAHERAVPAIPAAAEEPHFGPDGVSEVRIVEEMSTPGTPKLTLRWPSETERRIVTLRVVPKAEPRFSGRALRQAFSGCGFWHGPMDIYHLPDEQGQVLLSAAALAQPGTFDPSIMDSQRFSGLNLFAVLPGPMPQREVFEELVHAARQLAERLGGQITDQHGAELTAERIARLRQSLEAAA